VAGAQDLGLSTIFWFQDLGFLCEGAVANIVVYNLEKQKARVPETVHDLAGH